MLTGTKNKVGAPQLYPGAKAFLEQLSVIGKRAEIISSHPQDHLAEELAANGLTSLVAGVTGSVSNKTEVIGDILRRGEYKAEQAVYIGDTVQDMQAARASGVGAVAVTYGYHSEERLQGEYPDLMAHSLHELTSYLDAAI